METSLLMQISHEFQALSGADGLAVLTLAILEGILSVDNSLVLAIFINRYNIGVAEIAGRPGLPLKSEIDFIFRIFDFCA